MTADTPKTITDWDAAYANGAAIAGADRYYDLWPQRAAKFRAGTNIITDITYGDAPRETFDLVLPGGSPKGLFVFIHGGYWKATDKSYWTHLAAGPQTLGWAVALPNYTLCPDIRIAGITRQIGRAVTAAAERIAGPIIVCGHSAGGHLAARMVCSDRPIASATGQRIIKAISISGLHDLRPLMKTVMNQVLNIDHGEAALESPALLQVAADARIDCAVGGDELPEFLRQNGLLAQHWAEAEVTVSEIAGRHHFDVIEALEDPKHPILRALA